MLHSWRQRILFLAFLGASFLVDGLPAGAVMKVVEKETFKFVTPDYFNIAADFYFDAASMQINQPCVVLVHQFYQTKEQWRIFPQELVEVGYKVLAYDIRGHGGSDKIKDMTILLSDPQQTPFDFDEAMSWLKEKKGVDTNKLAVVGTSVGGCIACFANACYGENVKTAVAISSSRECVLGFLKHKPGKRRMRSILYIAAKGDGTSAQDAEDLATKYTDPPTSVKVFDDAAENGVDLFNKRAEVKRLVIDWLTENIT